MNSGGLSLYVALEKGHLEIAYFLVEKGADVNSSGMLWTLYLMIIPVC